MESNVTLPSVGFYPCTQALRRAIPIPTAMSGRDHRYGPSGGGGRDLDRSRDRDRDRDSDRSRDRDRNRGGSRGDSYRGDRREDRDRPRDRSRERGDRQADKYGPRGGGDGDYERREASSAAPSYEDCGNSGAQPAASGSWDSKKEAENDPTWARIYISNLPDDVTSDELQEMFGALGVVAREKQKRGYKDQWPFKIKIYTDDSGKPKGDAVLTYEDANAARTAPSFFDGACTRVWLCLLPGISPTHCRGCRHQLQDKTCGARRSRWSWRASPSLLLADGLAAAAAMAAVAAVVGGEEGAAAATEAETDTAEEEEAAAATVTTAVAVAASATSETGPTAGTDRIS